MIEVDHLSWHTDTEILKIQIDLFVQFHMQNTVTFGDLIRLE